ncbi:hypothetical protein BJ944DRAFT_242073 [Cunninghamella echinulata]|nr:hypothetical protein BJ944DRAFT_242073 [Cunninghamella echinulata]
MSRFQEHFNSSQYTLSSTSTSNLSVSSGLSLTTSSTNHSIGHPHHHHHHQQQHEQDDERYNLEPIKKSLSSSALGRFNTLKRKSRSETEMYYHHHHSDDEEKIKLNSYMKIRNRIGTFYQGMKRRSSSKTESI